MPFDGEVVTVVGSIGDVELKFTASGKRVANFSILEKKKGQSEGTYHNIVAWEDLAENIFNSCPKFTRVIVRGLVREHEYNGKSRPQITAWSVGPDLSWATAVVTKQDGGVRVETKPATATEDPF